MKKTLLLMVLTSTLAMVACKKDEQTGLGGFGGGSGGSTSGGQASSEDTFTSGAVENETGGGAEATVEILSDSTTVSEMTIKRFGLGDTTMETFNPDPKETTSQQDGSLILTVCAPRIKIQHLSSLADLAYPILLTGNSQVILRRDKSYSFGDGSNASSAPGQVLMTCDTYESESDAATTPKSANSAAQVQVKELVVGQSTMETMNPNPRGTNGQQPGVLTLVSCENRITDTNINQFLDVSYPIVLTAGSQIAILRDQTYQFRDGTNANTAAGVVLITCSK